MWEVEKIDGILKKLRGDAVDEIPMSILAKLGKFCRKTIRSVATHVEEVEGNLRQATSPGW